MMKKEEILEKANKYSFSNYAPKIVVSKGKGAVITDIDGKKYLDFTSGIAVCNLGHCHPKVVKAVKKQAEILFHCSNIFFNENQPQLAEKVAEASNFDGRVFFCNSGAEANEAMIKLARRFGNKNDRNKIICIENAFHGRTLATLAATGKAKYLEGFTPVVEGFVHAKQNNFESLKRVWTPDCCAVLLEIVQGEGGIVIAEKQWLQDVRDFCNEKNMLLMIDEVQTGVGRSGKMFAFQNFGIEPDVFSMAKGLGNGLPIGGICAKQELNEIFPVGSHGTTFGGNPVACAAGIAVFNAIKEEKLLENCNEMGEYLTSELKKVQKEFPQVITEIRGLGLLVGAEIDRKYKVADILNKCRENGLLVLSAGENVLRILPPLIVTKELIDKAIKIIRKSIKITCK